MHSPGQVGKESGRLVGGHATGRAFSPSVQFAGPRRICGRRENPLPAQVGVTGGVALHYCLSFVAWDGVC